MPLCKITIFFANGAAGWGESFFCDTPDLDVGYTAGIKLADIRRNLLGAPTQTTYLRVADTDNPRKSTLTQFGIQTSWLYSENADEPHVTAFMKVYTAQADTRSRQVLLRGNPDSAFDTKFPDSVDAQKWKTWFANLRNFLSTSGQGTTPAWCIKAKTRTAAGSAARIVIDDWAVGDPASVTDIATESPHGLNVGNFVTIYNVKGLLRPPGLLRVVAVEDEKNFSVLYHTYGDFSYEGGGYAVKAEFTYPAIVSAAPDPRWGSRATGRPFGSTRGRRPAIPK